MKKRKEPRLTGQQRAKARYRDTLTFARSIGETFPTVAKIDVSFTKRLDEGSPFPSTPQPGAASYSPDDKAVFWFECVSWDCEDSTEGSGHDLTPAIREAVADHITAVNGTHICQGWQDSRRIGAFRCLCRLEYGVRITYKP